MNEYEARIQYLENLATQLMTERQQMDAHHNAQQQRALIENVIRQKVAQLKKSNPAFLRAVDKYIRQPRIRELKQLGLSEAEAKTRTEMELDAEVVHYAAKGVDPLELALKTVQSKGWKPNGGDIDGSKEPVEQLYDDVMNSDGQEDTPNLDGLMAELGELGREGVMWGDPKANEVVDKSDKIPDKEYLKYFDKMQAQESRGKPTFPADRPTSLSSARSDGSDSASWIDSVQSEEAKDDAA